MNSINIINLMEINPLIKLSNTCNNKFLEKIKEEFTENEQDLFITLYYCHLTYNPILDFIIDLDDIWEWLGFSQKVNAKKLLVKYFIENIDYKYLKLYSNQTTHKNGGHNKQNILMNMNTFNLLCMKANTDKANEIHTYLVKLQHILIESIHKENTELKEQLSKMQNIENQYADELLIKKEKSLLIDFASSTHIIYIIKVKSYNNNEYVIKIGESRGGIEKRYKQHKYNYDECILLDCFNVLKNREFEQFIHNHPKIKPNKVINLENHEGEKELFLVNNNLKYSTVLQIIKDNIKLYNEYTRFEIEKLQNELSIYKNIIDLMNSTNSNKSNNDIDNNIDIDIDI